MRPARVLLVDDDRDTRVVFRTILEHYGFEVLEAGEGREALRVARQQIPHLVLLDLSLPVLDGWEVARTLKGESRTSSIPIVAFSAHALESARRRALEAGCDSFLVKPILPREVVQEVQRLLGRGESIAC
jgi:two-component system cell cycle response regulator DivK